MDDYSFYELIGGPEGIDAYDEAEARFALEAAEAEAQAWSNVYESAPDDGFEAWEMGRGCYLDPQSGYSI